MCRYTIFLTYIPVGHFCLDTSYKMDIMDVVESISPKPSY